MVVGPLATPVEWRGVSVKVPRRPPTFGNARSGRRHRHLGRAAGDERGKDHTNRRSDPIADLGLVSSGGFAPLEALSPFYQAYADWLPLRYAVDGLRSLLFYDGTFDAAGLEGSLRDALPFFSSDDGCSDVAGLEDAIWVLGAYLASYVMLGYAPSLIIDLLSTRRQKGPRKGRLQGSEAHL